MKKIKISKIIATCDGCIYCEYDPYYDCSKDSGYDCKKTNRRIIDDWKWDNTNNPKRLCKTEAGIPIPDWCPLPEV